MYNYIGSGGNTNRMTRAYGKDVAYYQGAIDPAINEIAEDFMIVRSGYGGVQDKKFFEYYHLSLLNPVRGIYHYHSSALDWKAEADHYLRLVQGKNYHFNVLDLERPHNVVGKSWVKGAGQWLEYVKYFTGKPTLYYTNIDVYENVLSLYADWLHSYNLWIAQYAATRWIPWLNTVPTDERKQPRLPKGATEYRLWQFSADGNKRGKAAGVQSRDIDLDVYNGSLDDVKAWLRIDQQPEPEPAPKSIEERVSSLEHRLDSHIETHD